MNESVKILLEVVDKASPQLQQFQSNLQKTGVALKSFASAAAGLAAGAVVAVGAGLAAITKNAINTADEMGKTAQKMGITVESLSALNYAAGLSDVSLEQLKTGFGQLNKSMVEANDPASAAAAAFKYLGVEVKNADGSYRKADEVFKDVAQSMSKLPDGTSKSAVAMEIFGKAGADLIPLLNSGRAGLEELRAEAEKLGLIISTETAKQAENFNDSLTRVGNAATGVGLSIAKEVLPTLNALAAQMIETVTKGEGFKDFAKSVGVIFKWVVKAGAGVVFVLGVIGKTVVGLGAAVAALADRDLEGAKQAISFIGDATSESAAELVKFNEAIDAGIPPLEKSKKATDDAANAAGNYAGKSKNVKDAKDAENKAFEKAYAALLKESEGYKDLTAVQQVQMNIEKNVAGFRTVEHQQRMLAIAQEIDARRQAIALAAGENEMYTRMFDTQQAAQAKLLESTMYFNKLIDRTENGGRLMAEEAARMTREFTAMSGAIETAQHQLDQLMKDPVNNKKAIEDLTARIDGMLGVVNAGLDEYINKLQFSDRLQLGINIKTEAYQKYVGAARDALVDAVLHQNALNDLLKQEKITTQEWTVATEQINKVKLSALKAQLTELQQKTADFAGQLQNTFGDAFYNIMQGNFKDIGTMFKQMLDKMVAEALAAKLAQALFGDFQRTGSVSGTGGGLLTSLVGSLFSFRAAGGPVTAGQPYIVGEKRPEIFVPRTSGTILPDTSALAMAGGNNVQFSITAMDSQDVLRAMDKIKRPLADMMNGTNRAYNLG